MSEIRRAATGDIPVLLDLMSEFYAESDYPLDRTWAAESFRRLLGDAARGGVWIARNGSETAGYVVLALRHSMEFGGLAGIIDDLFVRPAHRRQRHGIALLDAAFEECRRLGALAVEVEVGDDNAVAANLYRGFGLVAIDEGRRHLAVRLQGSGAPEMKGMPLRMRIARPVSSLARAAEMYKRGLGLEEIGRFGDHQGFDGVMLGRSDLQYHFEFAYCRTHPVAPNPTPEDLVVFYIGDRGEWERACAAMLAAGFKAVTSFNPYWEKNGRTFEDPDHYRVVLEQST